MINIDSLWTYQQISHQGDVDLVLKILNKKLYQKCE